MRSKFEEYFFERIGHVEPLTKTEDSIDRIVAQTGLDKEVVESIVALVNKTLTDWNRDKKIEGNKIEKVVLEAIKSNLIDIA